MKKTLWIVLGLAALLIAVPPYWLGFSVFQLGHTFQVASSMTAKLACSAKFVSGFSQQQIIDDVASYSSVTKLVDIEYDLERQTVQTDMLGISQSTAQYVPGLGCYLAHSDLPKLELTPSLSLPMQQNALWPAGSKIETDLSVQAITEEIIRQDNLAGHNTRALVVIKDGKLVAESYAQNTNALTPLLGWSMAKSVTAMTLGRMEQTHSVDLNQTHLFPQWNDERGDIQLKQLLTMTSGLDFSEKYAPGSDATKMLFSSANAASLPLDSAVAFPAGHHFSYSSGTSNLLADWIHTVLGDSLQSSYDYLHSQILEPSGIHSLVFETDATGVTVGSSYLFATARDWARLGWIMANEGSINGHQLLSEQWVSDAQQPNSSDNEKAYGYQFWLNSGDTELRWPSLPEDGFAMLGSRKQSVMMIPSQRTVLVRLGWSRGEYPMEQNYRRILDEF
jgi:CubicO group peptidase (beta-lactamase class C family)